MLQRLKLYLAQFCYLFKKDPCNVFQWSKYHRGVDDSQTEAGVGLKNTKLKIFQNLLVQFVLAMQLLKFTHFFCGNLKGLNHAFFCINFRITTFCDGCFQFFLFFLQSPIKYSLVHQIDHYWKTDHANNVITWFSFPQRKYIFLYFRKRKKCKYSFILMFDSWLDLVTGCGRVSV